MPAKPTLVLFVRHGTTPTTGKVLPGRARGLHLSERGREQAQRAAERIAVFSFVVFNTKCKIYLKNRACVIF